jgi:hypothetical protein
MTDELPSLALTLADRERWEAELRNQHGDNWMDEHREMLDSQWEILENF